MIYDNLLEFKTKIAPEGTILCVDYGEVKIGIAVSEDRRSLAFPVEPYQRRNSSVDIGHIARLARDREAAAFVMGLPLDNNGNEGENCVKVRNFAQKLTKRTGLPVLLYDERFTTSAVTRDMKQAGVKRKKRHEADDRLAAAYLLQMVLDRL